MISSIIWTRRTVRDGSPTANRLRRNHFGTVALRWSVSLEQERDGPAECSKRLSSKAAGKSKPEAYPLGYVEAFDEPRTPLADFFSILPQDC
jgi:hypothetical protein